ncbi:hypothetical protein N9Y92_01560 [Chlamydiales bacterium]|nr:hypothetical protein [Chlamydiales bacterium]
MDVYAPIHQDLIGKTSTSEVIERLNLGQGLPPFQVCHTWGGTISFESLPLDDGDLIIAKDPFGQPELVVVVYLRYGRLGKETLPLAALLAKKWREIKAKHE